MNEWGLNPDSVVAFSMVIVALEIILKWWIIPLVKAITNAILKTLERNVKAERKEITEEESIDPPKLPVKRKKTTGDINESKPRTS